MEYNKNSFGEDIFDVKPLQGGKSKVYFLPTELIDIALPFYLLNDGNLRRFFKKMDIENPSLELISEIIASSERIQLEVNLRDNTMKLSPKID